MPGFVCLLLHSFHYFRLGINDIQYAYTADPVKEPVSVHILDHGSLTTLDHHRSMPLRII